jgi:hypothetical protein
VGIQPQWDYDGVEFWFEAQTRLYHAYLGDAATNFKTLTDPPPAPGSNIQWGFRLECDYNGSCTRSDMGPPSASWPF